MSDNLKTYTWLIGAGNMGIEYAKVLSSQNIKFDVIGRGENSAKLFEENTGIKPIIGGIEKTSHLETPRYAIVAVNVEELANTAIKLVQRGVKRILVEKPAGINANEINLLNETALKYGTEIIVAYNRRFYASTIKAKELIVLDGGVTSYTFEFTEWAHSVLNSNHPNIVLNNWFLANSTHVVDLAFFLGGLPVSMNSYTANKLNWHSIAVFTGAGYCTNGALFSYHANWDAPGRWGVEILTKKHRLIFRPIEKLQILELNSVTLYDASEVDYSLDQQFKPGLYRQVTAFYNDDKNLLSIHEHIKSLHFYEQILTGK